ncbi:DUF1259 domain-containing protein [Geomesophilobacter sediminis]|uniref:DUF1259 domain-containing protein n=1 Tax=Geomesophilobacter sediminis TaxID=2798584 RepID=A0A8J7M1C0_9BACT|nr:DUF1259 domain-containing protein [Geomesophilobacter sediminis]MBJ6726822.1 DUF1259 domain-containing protein [Geomesophilobacter sediminis]
MKRALLLLGIVLFGFTSAYAKDVDWSSVEKVFAQKGKAQGNAFKVTFPRSDLSVLMGEVKVEPGLALTSWIGFDKMGKNAMMMGDLVLLESEVGPVTAKLVEHGLKVTALHNHLIGSNPPVLYLHFAGEGDPGKLAAAMYSALSVTATPMTPPKTAAAATYDWRRVEAILGREGQKKGDLLQYSIPRREKVKEHGMEIPPFLGVGQTINLQAVGGKVATTGDFVLIGSEVNPVVKALTEHGIMVTAVHSHMLFESPRLFFLHFWAYDTPEKVATGLKAALGKVNLAK